MSTTTIYIQLSETDRNVLQKRAESRGTSIEFETQVAVHNSVLDEHDPFGVKGLPAGSAMAKIWESYDGPEFEFEELRGYGTLRDPFSDDEQ